MISLNISQTMASRIISPHWKFYNIVIHNFKGYTPFMNRSEVKSLSRVWLFVTPWTVVHQAPPSMGFSRQEYWSGLPFPSPGDLPDPGIEPRSPRLQADALTSEPPGKQILAVIPHVVQYQAILINVALQVVLKLSSFSSPTLFLSFNTILAILGLLSSPH